MSSRCRETQALKPAPLFTPLVKGLLFIAAALLFNLLSPPPALSQNLTEQQLKELKRSIVKITASGATGTGIVVGSADDTVFIVTALHVVAGATDIRVTFFDKRHEAALRAQSHRTGVGLDFAVIKVTMPGGKAFASKLPVLELSDIDFREGATVHTIGQGNDSDWQFYPGKVVREEDDTDFRKFRHNDQIEQGDSGAPVFDDKGHLLGMVTTRMARMKGASSLKMEALYQILKDAWGVPTSLLRSSKASKEDYEIMQGPGNRKIRVPKPPAEALKDKKPELEVLIAEGEGIRKSSLTLKDLKEQYDDWKDRCVTLLSRMDENKDHMGIKKGLHGQRLPDHKDEFEDITKLDTNSIDESRLHGLITQKLFDGLKYLKHVKKTTW